MKSDNTKRSGRTVILMTAALLTLNMSAGAQACTRILWNTVPDSKVGALVGRTMDWPATTSPVLTFFPRGSAHHGGKLGELTVVGHNAVNWKAKYASLVTTIYGIGAADGVNEKGLAAHLLYLNETDMTPRDTSRPGLQVALWAQYVLDNAATVTEALDELNSVQLVMATVTGPGGRQIKGTVHLVMEDATGDSALIEYIDGKKVVYHDRDVGVVTNDPPYEQQMFFLSQQRRQLAARGDDTPDSNMPLPGNVSPEDRLARASYFLSLFPAPADKREGVAGMLAIARNVSVPFGAPYRPKEGMAVYNTEYRTVISLKDRNYFFELSTQPGVVWTTLSQITVPPVGQVMRFDPYAPQNVDMSGDISTRFIPAPAPY